MSEPLPHDDAPHAIDPRDDLPNHLPALRAFAISLTGNVALADDMVQDTIVKAWTHIDSYKPGTNMRAWLFTILRNTFYSHRRKHKREQPDPEGVHAAGLYEKPAHDSKLAMTDFRDGFRETVGRAPRGSAAGGGLGLFHAGGRRDDRDRRRHREKPGQPGAGTALCAAGHGGR